MARILSDNLKNSVLLLEAGEDRSDDPAIYESSNAWNGRYAYVWRQSPYIWAFLYNDVVWCAGMD